MRRFATLWKYAYILYTLYILLRMSSPPQLKEDEWTKNSRWGSIKYILILIDMATLRFTFIYLLRFYCLCVIFVIFLNVFLSDLLTFLGFLVIFRFIFHLWSFLLSLSLFSLWFLLSCFIILYMVSSNFHEFVTSDFSFYTLFSYDKKTVLPKDCCTMYIICFVLF